MCSWDNIYSSITYEWSGKEFKAGLTGNKSFIWAAGVMAVIACAMTAIDAAVLARTMRTGAARARPGKQSPTMTDFHNSSCNTGSSRCVTYPSAQQTNGAPAAGASDPSEVARQQTADAQYRLDPCCLNGERSGFVTIYE